MLRSTEYYELPRLPERSCSRVSGEISRAAAQKAEHTIAHGKYRCDHSAPLELAQHRLPALGTLPITILDHEQLLPVGARAEL